MRYGVFAGALLLSMSQSHAAGAAQIGHIEVSVRRGGYEFAVDAVIDAPKSRVFAILSDYAHLGRINPDITSSTFAPSPSGSAERVRTVLHSCVWLVCRNLVQVEDVTEPDADTIVARIVPGAGAFTGGSSLWRLDEDGPNTRLHYEATRRLSAWIPPLVGPSVIKRALRARLRASIEALERVAQHGR